MKECEHLFIQQRKLDGSLSNPFCDKCGIMVHMDEELEWICLDCAEKRGGKIPDHHMPTWHYDLCPVCKSKKAVTEPRDFSLNFYKSNLKNI